MTTIGHSLTGLSIGLFALPKKKSRLFITIYAVAFIILANFPDIEIKNWGHNRYDISHSIFVNLLLILILFLSLKFSKNGLNTIERKKIFFAGTLAWLSHLLLDSFYNHGKGIAIYWPFSDGRLNFSIPWFSTLQPPPPPLTSQAIEVYTIELLFYLPIFLFCLYLRRELVLSDK